MLTFKLKCRPLQSQTPVANPNHAAWCPDTSHRLGESQRTCEEVSQPCHSQSFHAFQMGSVRQSGHSWWCLGWCLQSKASGFGRETWQSFCAVPFKSFQIAFTCSRFTVVISFWLCTKTPYRQNTPRQYSHFIWDCSVSVGPFYFIIISSKSHLCIGAGSQQHPTTKYIIGMTPSDSMNL